jgi:hypothetical protein
MSSAANAASGVGSRSSACDQLRIFRIEAVIGGLRASGVRAQEPAPIQ